MKRSSKFYNQTLAVLILIVILRVALVGSGFYFGIKLSFRIFGAVPMRFMDALPMITILAILVPCHVLREYLEIKYRRALADETTREILEAE